MTATNEYTAAQHHTLAESYLDRAKAAQSRGIWGEAAALSAMATAHETMANRPQFFEATMAPAVYEGHSDEQVVAKYKHEQQCLREAVSLLGMERINDDMDVDPVEIVDRLRDLRTSRRAPWMPDLPRQRLQDALGIKGPVLTWDALISRVQVLKSELLPAADAEAKRLREANAKIVTERDATQVENSRRRELIIQKDAEIRAIQEQRVGLVAVYRTLRRAVVKSLGMDDAAVHTDDEILERLGQVSLVQFHGQTPDSAAPRAADEAREQG